MAGASVGKALLELDTGGLEVRAGLLEVVDCKGTMRMEPSEGVEAQRGDYRFRVDGATHMWPKRNSAQIC